jgi:murein DD-endopeptidase MepM/ murein hydrolase activator NlpD
VNRIGGAALALVVLAALGSLAHADATFAQSQPAPPATGTMPVAAAPLGDAPSAALALAALDRKIADLDSEETADKRELSSLGTRIGELHARVLARGKSFYRMTRAGMLPVGGGFDALVAHAMRVERARRTLSSDVTGERQLREHAVELSSSLERVARDRFALASQRTAMDAARLAMDDEQHRQLAFDKAFEVSGAGGGSGSGEYVAIYGGAGASPDLGNTGGFHASRGRLLFPVAGRADARPARREGTDGPGLEIRAALGSVVRAVFSGRVAFADRYGPYGRIIIIDHGEHYYSVSGNLASADVKVGDELSAGERLGTVGDDGQGAMLYFEIRHGTETIAPGPWLGLSL